MHPVNREPIDIFVQPGDFHFGSSGIRVRAILASSVSVVMWHCQRRIGGMCHYVLPERRPHLEAQPDGGRAVDALQGFMQEIGRAGASCGEYDVKLIGGGRLFKPSTDTGRRDIDVARRLLRHYGLKVQNEHLAGVGYRHVIFDIGSGALWLKHVADASLAWIRI